MLVSSFFCSNIESHLNALETSFPVMPCIVWGELNVKEQNVSCLTMTFILLEMHKKTCITIRFYKSFRELVD